jgi:FtsP/CotA-like multicopper oxidase with cupredoxin domain
MKIKVLLVAEMTVRAAAPVADLNAKLDAFREAVQPASDYGLTLYQATAEDFAAFIGPLWKAVEGDAVTCERCQRETEAIGDCGYCVACCE